MTIRLQGQQSGAALRSFWLAMPSVKRRETHRGENAVNVLQTAFTGPIAKGACPGRHRCRRSDLRFGEGGGKKTFAGIVFGLGMAVLAVNFLTWLFGV